MWKWLHGHRSDSSSQNTTKTSLKITKTGRCVTCELEASEIAKRSRKLEKQNLERTEGSNTLESPSEHLEKPECSSTSTGYLKVNRDYRRSRACGLRTPPDEKIKAYTKGKITGDVHIKVKPQGLTLEFETKLKSYRKTYDEYTPDKYRFIRQEGQNPKVTEVGDRTYIEFSLTKIL